MGYCDSAVGGDGSFYTDEEALNFASTKGMTSIRKN